MGLSRRPITESHHILPSPCPAYISFAAIAIATALPSHSIAPIVSHTAGPPKPIVSTSHSACHPIRNLLAALRDFSSSFMNEGIIYDINALLQFPNVRPAPCYSGEHPIANGVFILWREPQVNKRDFHSLIFMQPLTRENSSQFSAMCCLQRSLLRENIPKILANAQSETVHLACQCKWKQCRRSFIPTSPSPCMSKGT